MVKIQQNWFCAVRRICDTERGTILCEVACGSKAGQKAIIRASWGTLLVQFANGEKRNLPENLTCLLVSEEDADILAAVAQEIAEQNAVATHMALWDAARRSSKAAGRWADGTFRTHGAVR